jgi:B12 binding domain
MRIAFISANREMMPDAVIPLGVLSVMAATPGHHEKIFWDLCFEADPLGTVARNLRESQPDLVAIGLRNLQNMDYTNITSNLDAYRALIQAVRANSSAPIVLGGGGFSVTPQALMEDLGADYGIAGEGERAFAKLLDELERPEAELREVERLYYRAGGQLRFTGSASISCESTTCRGPSAERCLNAITRIMASSRCKRSEAVPCTARTAPTR